VKKDDESPEAPSDQPQDRQAPDTPWLSNRLTEAEIEALRQNKKDSLAYAQRMFFPNARIHRAKEDAAEEPKDRG